MFGPGWMRRCKLCNFKTQDRDDLEPHRQGDYPLCHSVLDNDLFAAKKYGQFRRESPRGSPTRESASPESMTTSRPAQPPAMTNDLAKCKHPRVRVVAREEDAEFVECLECGEVFESSEFKDMDIEESKLEEAE